MTTTIPFQRAAAHAPKPTGRPRFFDDARRREVRALLSAGCGLDYAARYVGCSPSTLRRELDRNPEFRTAALQAEADSNLEPLNYLRQATRTHWRAAAWYVERTMPERFGRRPPVKKFDPTVIENLTGALGAMIRAEKLPASVKERLERRGKAIIELVTDTSDNPREAVRALRAGLYAGNPFAEMTIPDWLWRASPERETIHTGIAPESAEAEELPSEANEGEEAPCDEKPPAAPGDSEQPDSTPANPHQEASDQAELNQGEPAASAVKRKRKRRHAKRDRASRADRVAARDDDNDDDADEEAAWARQSPFRFPPQAPLQDLLANLRDRA